MTVDVAIAVIGKLLYDLSVGVITNILASKTLSILEGNKKDVVVNSPFMQAFLRALIGSVIQQLDTWSGQHADEEKSFARFSKSKLEKFRTECEKELLSFVNENDVQKMLEGVRRQEQVDATVLAEDVLEFLRGLWSDSEHDIPESFRSYMKENEGKAFNGVLLEQFKKEITKDQEVFNSFTADFLTKIYKKSDVDRVFPRVISPKLVGFRSRSLV